MRKTIAILMILAVILPGVFAADTATVKLNSTVDGDFLFGVSKTKVPDYASLEAAQADNPYSNSATFENAFERPATVYVGYVTNNLYTIPPSISFEAEPFFHTENSNLSVGYSISINDAEGIPLYKDLVSIGSALGFYKLGNAGLRQEDVKLTFTANADDVGKAAAGDYTATITFRVTSNG